MIYGGLNKTFGVYFLHYQKRFHAKAAEVAVMTLIASITTSVVALFVMTLGVKKLSVRTVVAIGTGLFVTANILTAFTTDIRMFYLLQGFVHGTGISMVRSPTISIIGIYFNKHRGLAMSIYTGCASIGGLIFAPVVTTLFKEYGFTGTLLITGGLVMNTWVAASVMRPPAWFAETHKRRKTSEAYEKILDNIGQSQEYKLQEKRKLNTDALDQVELNSNMVNDKEIANEKSNHAENSLKNRDRKTSQEYEENETTSMMLSKQFGDNSSSAFIAPSKVDLCSHGDITYGSAVSIHVLSNETTESDDHKESETCCILSTKQSVIDLLKLFDFELLKNINFILFLAMAFMLISGMVLMPYYLPQFAKDAGLTYDQIAVMLSALAISEFASKIVSGIIADREWFRRSTLLAFAAIAVGSLCQFARFFTTFTSVVVMAAILACFYGWYTSMYTTILIDCVGLGKFQSSLGFVSVVHGMSIAVCFPVAGVLRDISGSYIPSLHMAGGLCYAGAVFLLLMPVVKTYQKKKELTDRNRKEMA